MIEKFTVGQPVQLTADVEYTHKATGRDRVLRKLTTFVVWDTFSDASAGAYVMTLDGQTVAILAHEAKPFTPGSSIF